MSFFGFDPTGPSSSRGLDDDQLETYNYEDTYEGLGDEGDDALNDETFGAASSNIGKDFDFTGGMGMKPAAPSQPTTQHISYAQAAQTDEILQPMASLWTDESKAATGERPTEPKILSLEEIEAKLRGNQPQQHLQMPPPPQQQLPPYMLLPPQIQQQILNAAVASGQFPNAAAAAQAMSQGFMPPPPPFNQGMMPPQFMPFPPQMAQQQMLNIPSQFNQGIPPMTQQQQPPVDASQQQQQQSQPPQQQQQQPPQQHQIPQQPKPQQHQNLKQQLLPSQDQQQARTEKRDVDFPVLGATKEEPGNHITPQEPQTLPQQQPQQQHQQQSQHQQQQNYRNNYNNSGNNGNNGNNRHHHFNQQQRQHQHQLQMQQQFESMTPEEREKFLTRQQKVSKITRCSGFMNPRDKDFVTRFQLSQIVTDDPYNEDFYCQVYKVLNSSIHENNMSSIAQKYLDQSGHRLGGRSKRADVALQRMQQQVSKAVTVAKERGERTGVLSREGALGKVSFGTGKEPRKQLVLKTKEESADAEDDYLPKEYSFSKSSRTFQLSIIENIYSQILKLESMERENQEFTTVELWKSLHLSDKMSTSSGEVIGPFISILSFDKMMKVFNRLFHFLTAEQKFQLIEYIFTNLQKIDVILKGSYKNYIQENYEVPEAVTKKIDLFQLTIMKTLVLYLSESKFQDVLRVLDVVISNNNVLFLSTTKLGLSLVTILTSRLELIKQEFAQSLSAQDLSQWQFVYDKLFQCLEGRLTTIFPPYLSNDESKKVKTSTSGADDSYIWQFLASLSLAGLLNHQRIIVDEIRNEIFGIMALAKTSNESGDVEKANKALGNLNLFLNVMGLKATENDISELS
ncbi:hypothetical protein CANARDRAFT_6497 [[Candida] arabinofermentans NRRL YB-2248]|uniref:mRNA decay factor PAT1 domain-containing protein n=1 Tax=[Candida] arabinofermentans NRRL YB-2248 TaxID=983967 RepID=A0A1E4T590_9ASCO|nr:hypothetical protein CANARDRAFT_6497 [[Candida] arabinofermentans NRRL YB-2248]